MVLAQISSQPISVDDLQKQIQDLLKQIQTLQKQVAALQAELGKPPEPSTPAQVPTTPNVSSEPEAVPPEFTRSLSRGSSGDDVRKLQEFLAKDKEIYPEGLITGFFGPLTEAAVKRWQEKNEIEPMGVIGPKSIAKFQELGRGVVQGLIQQGAGSSGVIPPGLLTAPGIQKKNDISTATPSTATTTGLLAPSTVITPSLSPLIASPTVPAPLSVSSITNYSTSKRSNY